jgi:hypothetical protein
LRILADENIPKLAVERLQEHGHDVVWVRLSKPGAVDEDVLACAVNEKSCFIDLG